jgi:hypothetical protein
MRLQILVTADCVNFLGSSNIIISQGETKIENLGRVPRQSVEVGILGYQKQAFSAFRSLGRTGDLHKRQGCDFEAFQRIGRCTGIIEPAVYSGLQLHASASSFASSHVSGSG